MAEPKDVLYEVADSSFLKRISRDHATEKPGDIIQSLSPEKRAAESRPKSDDVRDIRPDIEPIKALQFPVRTRMRD